MNRRAPFFALALALAIAAGAAEAGQGPPAPADATAPAPVDDQPIGLAELPPYLAALEGRTPGAATPATFRDLWDRPDAFRGRRVKVEGIVRRRFRQAPRGQFPATIETWISTPSGDLLCLVSPASAPADPGPAAVGAAVRFAGTFLKRIRYESGDGPRLAPLVIGPDPPDPMSVAPGPGSPDGWSRVDWALGLGAGLVVLLALGRASLRRPPRRTRDDPSPPEFLS